uniref:Serum amyloid A protein n=1 Tax=Rhinolophus ferrumequinum TaxID=59479 RepID=A0A671FZH5_RHIFE
IKRYHTKLKEKGKVNWIHFALGGWAVAHHPLSLLPASLHSSDAREDSQRVTDLFKHGDSGHGEEDSKADQFANEWGRSGKDPNHFRPDGLPDEY